MKPKIGQYLYSTCSAEDYGKVLAIGVDGNGANVISIELNHAADITWCEDDSEEFPSPDLSRIEVLAEIKLILIDIQYREFNNEHEDSVIICRTPGNGCFRCTKMFWLKDKPSE